MSNFSLNESYKYHTLTDIPALPTSQAHQVIENRDVFI